MFESLIQWVKVVYANELKNKQSGNKENSLNILMDSNGNFCRSQFKSQISNSVNSQKTVEERFSQIEGQGNKNQTQFQPEYDINASSGSNLNILNSYASNPSSSAINPMTTMNTIKEYRLQNERNSHLKTGPMRPSQLNNFFNNDGYISSQVK